MLPQGYRILERNGAVLVKKLGKIFKRIVFLFISFVVAFSLLYFTLSKFAFMDPFAPCFIWIDGDSLRGNVKTIYQALISLRKENLLEFKKTCTYVSKIHEGFCVGIAEGVSTRSPGNSNDYVWPDACYLSGSKVIYIKPDKNQSLVTVNERMQFIMKYSEKSRIFWEEGRNN